LTKEPAFLISKCKQTGQVIPVHKNHLMTSQVQGTRRCALDTGSRTAGI